AARALSALRGPVDPNDHPLQGRRARRSRDRRSAEARFGASARAGRLRELAALGSFLFGVRDGRDRPSRRLTQGGYASCESRKLRKAACFASSASISRTPAPAQSSSQVSLRSSSIWCRPRSLIG